MNNEEVCWRMILKKINMNKSLFTNTVKARQNEYSIKRKSGKTNVKNH